MRAAATAQTATTAGMAADLRMDGALIDALIIITSLRPECPAYTNLRYRNLV